MKSTLFVMSIIKAHPGADPVGGPRGLQPPLLVAASIRNKGELGKKKMGEEKNRERRGWERGGRRHQPPTSLG